MIEKIKPADRSGHRDGRESCQWPDKQVTYKGYTIHAVPREIVEAGLWSLSLFIMRLTERGERSWHFSASDRYATEEEAMTNCIAYGQLIIDGKIPNLSVG